MSKIRSNIAILQYVLEESGRVVHFKKGRQQSTVRLVHPDI
jgi:hypothetical protein